MKQADGRRKKTDLATRHYEREKRFNHHTLGKNSLQPTVDPTMIEHRQSEMVFNIYAPPMEFHMLVHLRIVR